MIRKKFCFVLAAVLLSVFLVSCYDKHEIDEMAYVIAVGFDKGTTNYLKMTLEFAIPGKSGAGQSSGGDGGSSAGGGEGKATSITTVEVPSIYSGVNMANTYISKQINFSQAKIVVFSEELAREGIQKYIHAMIRGREFRGNMHVAVARGSAEDYIKNVTSKLELDLSKYYEMEMDAFKYTGFTANTQLINFYLFEECSCREGYATLVGVNKYRNSSEITSEKSTYRDKGRDYPLEGDFYAGDLPKISDTKSELMGLAVFLGDKMVGELDGEETTYQLMLYGTFVQADMTFPDPMKKDSFIVLNVKPSRKPKQYTEIVNGKPQISAAVKLEADIVSLQSGINYESTGNMKTLENSVQDFLKKGMLRFLNKTKAMNSDVCGFGRNLKMRYLLQNDWTKVHWLDKYKDSSFNVSVDLKIRRPGLMIRSISEKSSEGD